MTIEELRQKPVGVLEKRTFTFKYKKNEYEESFYLIKLQEGWYFIGFSDDASYCSERISEETMVLLLNDVEYSKTWAFDIYLQDSHLSCWMN